MLRGVVFSWLVPSALSHVSIAAGGHVTCVLSGGRLRCWGQGSLGQLGQGDPRDLADASQIPPVSLGFGREATQVAVGKEHICARLSDDNVTCWGRGLHGQLGRERATSLLGSQSDDMDNLVAVDLGSLPALEVVAGGMQSCARLVDGSLRCWGHGMVGSGEIEDQAGLAMAESLAVDLEEPVLQVAAGNWHTCALLEAGAVKCWGSGDFDQLGRGFKAPQTELPAVDLGGEALEVAAGRGFACARLAKSQVKCWGSGSDGRLGSGSTDNIGDDAQASPALDLGSGRWAQALAAGEDHTCALLDDNSVKCWGKNDFGQLGQGHTRSIGDEPGEMGENLQPVDLGSNRHALAVAAGALHSCAILDDYSVKCWGYGAFGQLGNGGTASLGDEPLEMGDALPVSLFTKASSEGGAQEMHNDPPRPTRFLQASSSCCENSSTKSPCEVLQAYMESVLMTTTTTTLDITFATARMSSNEKRIITFCSMGLVATLLLLFIIFICKRTMAKRRARLEKLREDAAIRDMLHSDDDVSKMGSARALAAALEREVAPGPPSLGETLRPEQVPSPTTEPKQLAVPGSGRPRSPTPSETHSVRSGPFPPPAKASVPSPRPPPARSPRPGPPRPPGLKLPNYTSEEC